MKKFCPKCGGGVDDGGYCQACNTTQAPPQQQAPQQQAPQQAYQQPQGYQQPQQGYQQPQGYQQQGYAAPAGSNQNVETAKAAMRESIPFFKNYWNRPQESAQEVISQNNTPLAIVLTLIYCLANMIALFFPMNKTIDGINTTMSYWTGGAKFSMPYLTLLISSLCIGAALVLVSSGTILFICRICGREITFVQAFQAVSVATIPLSCCQILMALATILGSGKLWLFFGVIHGVLWFVLVTQIPSEIFGLRATAFAPIVLAICLGLSSMICSYVGMRAGFTIMANISSKEGTYGEMMDIEFDDFFDELVDGFDDVMGSMF